MIMVRTRELGQWTEGIERQRARQEAEERRKNGKHCQIYHIVPSRIILVICTHASLYTIFVWLPACVDTHVHI